MQPMAEAEPCMPAADVSRNAADLMMHFLTLAGRENPLGPWGSKLVSSMVNRVLWDHQGDKEQVPLPLPEALAIVAAVTEGIYDPTFQSLVVCYSQ